jgi:transposase
MALRELKEKVLEMRREGMSYSQIKAAVKVSKGTLSLWLRDMSLSKERILELGPKNQRRIENCRNTKAKKRQARLDSVYSKVTKDIGKLSKREIILSGIFFVLG